ncbi:MAG: SUMF1/EgtB/PvdO family nonheme iron enzyme [bacterium]|nr:SUMF1/EgtB/PvdO family nonheme iron enzyme [bacterium]
MESTTRRYDAFASYHPADRAQVEAVTRSLEERGLSLFTDREHSGHGTSWPQALGKVLDVCGSVIVFLGPRGLGSWQLREKELVLERHQASGELPVVPVLLPGADPPLGFLHLKTWVDMTDSERDASALDALEAVMLGRETGKHVLAGMRTALASVRPYRGLLPFREEDAEIFCGREGHAKTLVETVHSHSFVAVVGASGSGKTSLVRAGLLPRLRRANEQVWEFVTVVPGEQPLIALAAALVPLLEPDADEGEHATRIEELTDQPDKRAVSLRELSERILARQQGTDRILLAIDPWEELYTLSSDDALRQRFIDELLDASAQGAVTVVLTMRSDFFARAVEHRAIADRLQNAIVNQGPMTVDEMERAIRVPAEITGVQFEEGLVDTILMDAARMTLSLPSLELALVALWERRHDETISREAYEAIGGVQGAIAYKASSVFARMSEQQQKLARRLLTRMVRLGEGIETSCRPIALDKKDTRTLEVARDLAAARLLVIRPVPGSEHETAEFAHEALIHRWDELGDWVAEEREFSNKRERALTAAKLWDANGQNPELLLAPGPPLDEALGILPRRADLPLVVQEFIEVSMTERAKESAVEHPVEQKLRPRWQEIGVLVALLAVTAFAWTRSLGHARAAERANADLAQALESLRDMEEVQETADSAIVPGLIESAHVWPRGRDRTDALAQHTSWLDAIDGVLGRMDDHTARSATLAEDGRRQRLEAMLARRAELQALRAEVAARGPIIADMFDLWEDCGLVPQDGLVPLGRDNDSGLWEFWHTASGARPRRLGAAPREETGLVLVLLPGGTFQMGAQSSEASGANYDPDAGADEGPVHAVTLSPFFLSKYEMTHGQWARLTGGTASENDRMPAAGIAWNDCSRKFGAWDLELPTEAQWEYACRASSDGAFGPDAGADLERFAWYRQNSERKPHIVGAKAPNAFGIHDMRGNVYEWCRDGYEARFYATDAAGGSDPVALSAGGSLRVNRGGSFRNSAEFARPSARSYSGPAKALGGLGVRPARAIVR